MFSVVIPLYNKELSILRTIQSVLEQTVQDFEIVVINDGSTDKSAELVKGIRDSRLRLINQENKGVSAARNRGIKEAKYEWIAFLDGDDIWKNNHLEEIKRMMEKLPEFKVYVTSFNYSDNRVCFKHSRQSRIFIVKNYFLESIRENIIWTSIVVINRECFNKVGTFKENLNRGEDLDLWARIAQKYTIIKSSEITATYRIEAENRSIESFDIRKSRIYNYDFTKSKSEEETRYYRAQLNSSIRGSILQRRLKNCIQLIIKHHKHISLLDLLKIRKL